MKRLLPLLILFLFHLVSHAQSRLVSGQVTDLQNQPIPGVTVVVVGNTLTGTVTDLDGNFTLKAEPTSVLRFSFVGFEPQDITVGQQTKILVVLKEKTSTLDEVVVIGYGAQKKKDLTISVSGVSEKDLNDRPLVSAAQALQGKAAGVQVTQVSGKPGADIAVKIRGATSIRSGNDPLYVVDDVPLDNISGINPNDITSITVLKDASALAIYGSRAANGAVIVTTKRGKEEKSSISFSTYQGFSANRKSIDVLNTKQYRKLMGEIGIAMDPSWTDFNNWQDITFKTGHQQSYQLSTSGGTEKNRYYISGGYYQDKGMVSPARFDRYTLRFNLDNDIRTWLHLGTSISFWNINTKDTPDNASSGRGGVIMSALNTPPFLSVYKNDGSGWFDPNPFQPSWENPVAYMEGPDQINKEYKVFGGMNLAADLTSYLKFKTNLGVDILNSHYSYFLDPIRTTYGRSKNGIGRSSTMANVRMNIENTLEFQKSFDKHNLTALIGNTYIGDKNESSYIEGSDYPHDGVQTLNAANQILTASTYAWQSVMLSYFGRAMYNYANTYYLTASLRYDGSSKLNHKWGAFPSFSAGWRASTLPIFKEIKAISDLKLRVGWGAIGNIEGIGTYSAFGLVGYSRRTPTDPLSGPATYKLQMGNPDLRWESTNQWNFGIDLSLLENRFTITGDFYRKLSKDIIFNVELPTTLDEPNLETNAGEVLNKGIELSVNAHVIDHKKFAWSSDFNISYNKNKVTNIGLGLPASYYGLIYSNQQYATIVTKGEALGTFYGYVSDGVDPATGNMVYKDLNQNGIFDPGDRTVLGRGVPDLILGFSNYLKYRNFDLNLFFQGSFGNEIFNATRVDLEGMFDSKNQSVAVLDRWTPTNTNTSIPKAISNGDLYNVNNSSRFVENGSYLRLKSATLSYHLPTDKVKWLKALRSSSVYITATNLITLTKYTGFDPEVSAYGNMAIEAGIDYGTYPQSRSVVVGINIEL